MILEIENIPNHLMTYWIGVLIGMGIDYELSEDSTIYKVIREHRMEQYKQKEKNGEMPEGEVEFPFELCHFITHKGGNPEDSSITVRPVYREAECTT